MINKILAIIFTIIDVKESEKYGKNMESKTKGCPNKSN